MTIKNNGRIGFFLATRWGDGAERVVVTLANAIAARGVGLDLVLFEAKSYHGKVSEAVRVVDLGAYGAMASIPGLVKYLRRERPKAMLSTIEQSNIALLMARRLSRVPVRVVVREANTTSVSLAADAGLKGRLHRRLLPVCYPWADAFIAVSIGVADDLSSMMHIPRAKVNVVYNPIVPDQLRRRSAEPVDHRWFAPGQPPVIVGAGRLSPQKDFGNLLRAFAKLRTQVDARLLILGEGEERQNLESLAKELGVWDVVSMPGRTENACPYIARASLFVLSSTFEGLPNALIEAFVLGTPVVATDCPSGPKEILDGGRYGKLVPVGDSEALCSAMAESLRNGRAQTPPPEAVARFDLDYAVDAYLRVLEAPEKGIVG